MAANQDWMRNFGIGAGLGTAAGGLAGLFGAGQKNPAGAAMPYLNQIPGQVQPYYQPFIDAGKNSMGKTSGIYDQMSQNPGEYYNQLASGYKESPGYQHRLNSALQAGTNAQAAGGMAGSPQHEEMNMTLANDIAGKDFNDYMNQVFGINQAGLQGEENTTNRGYNASTGYGNILGSNTAQQAGLAFQGQAGQNQANAGNMGNVFGGIASLMPWLFM